MASYAELMAKARELAAAGRIDDARRVGQIAKKMKSSFPEEKGGISTNSDAVSDLSQKLKDTGTGAISGVSFGFADEMAGFKHGLADIGRGKPYMEGYTERRDDVRESQRTAQERNPGPYAAGNVLGAAVPALITAPLTGGGSLAATGLRSSGIGLVEGMLHAGGNADGQNVAENVAKGGAIGAGIGFAGPLVVAGGRAAMRAGSDPITGIVDALIKRPNKAKADRALYTAMQKSGKTEKDIATAINRARDEGQPEYRVMDALGIPGQRAASGLARSGDFSGDDIAKYLTSRQAGQPERVGAFVDDAFDMRGGSAAQRKAELNVERKALNDQNYTAARGNAAPVNLNETIESIDVLTKRNPILGDSALTNTEIGSRLNKLRGRLTAGDEQLIDFDTVLNVKQDLGKAIGRINKSGEEVPIELSTVYRKLDDALEKSSDMYRQANDAARAGRQNVAAVGEGAKMTRPNQRAVDTTKKFSEMTPEEQAAARVGYGDTLIGKIEASTSPTANKAKILQSPKRDAEAAIMALDPDKYGRRLSRENEMWEVQNRALGGSRTADNLQDIEGLGGLAGGAMDAGRSLINLNPGDAIGKIVRALGPVAKGQNAETRALIAKALMSDDPLVALAGAVKGGKRSRAVDAIIAALARSSLNQASTR